MATMVSISLVATMCLAICVGRYPVIADILVYNKIDLLIEEYRDLPARFGPTLSGSGLKLWAVAGYPSNGCMNITVPPKVNSSIPFAVIVARGGCRFEDKILMAQLAGYAAVIVHNVDSNALEPMSAQNGDQIIIPSVFVGEDTGVDLIKNYQYQTELFVVLNGDLPFDINTHLLLPFSIVAGLCFLIMIGFMVVKCVRERRRLQRHRLPRSALKAIPIVKFNKATMSYETCIICLDDYEDGEKLRVLPCDHAYHSKCIDVWLTKNRRVCPICKRKVLSKRHPNRPPAISQTHPSDDSQSDSDADDTTPLLNSSEQQNSSSALVRPNNHGTFSNSAPTPNVNQRVNPFDRQTNLPVHLVEADFSTLSIFARGWSRIRRNLDGPPPNEPPPNERPPDELIRSRPMPAASSSSTSSNNVLNANLSGSFQNSDDRPYTGERDRRARVAAALGFGVVAIPNPEFSPSPPAQSQDNNSVKPNNDFIV